MSKTFRNVGLSFMVVAYVALVVFFLVKDHKEDLSNVLSTSLDFIGGKLNAMVAEPAEKEAVTQAYNDFKQQVLDKKVPPDQVESIAANILNLSNSGVVITPHQAEDILQSVFVVNMKSDSILIDSLRYTISDPEIPIVSIAPEPKRIIETEELKHLGTRLAAIHDFEIKRDETMKKRFRDKRKDRPEFFRHMRYDSKDGLKIIVDSKTREQMTEQEYEQMNQELKHLQKEKLLIYQTNLAEELAKQKKRIEYELRILSEIKNKKKMDGDQKSLEIGVMESLKKLELVGLTSMFSRDSLRSVIIKFQQEADSIRAISVGVQKETTKK